jgi:hypothetical protein
VQPRPFADVVQELGHVDVGDARRAGLEVVDCHVGDPEQQLAAALAPRVDEVLAVTVMYVRARQQDALLPAHDLDVGVSCAGCLG